MIKPVGTFIVFDVCHSFENVLFERLIIYLLNKIKIFKKKHHLNNYFMSLKYQIQFRTFILLYLQFFIYFFFLLLKVLSWLISRN